MAMLTTTVEFDGAVWTINAVEAGTGIEFSIIPGKNNTGDIRGLFLDLAADINTGGILQSDSQLAFEWYGEGQVTGTDVTEVQWGEDLVVNLGQGANMNGDEPGNIPPAGYPGPNIFDLGIKFGTQGQGQDYINETTFFVSGITLADLAKQFVGIRLTSTGEDGQGSLKLVGQFPSISTNDPIYQGFSRGSWLNGARSGDLNSLFGGSVPSYESLFLGNDSDLVFTSEGAKKETFNNPTLTEALNLNGGGINMLAAQSTAAYLNALYLESDGNELTAYPLSTDQIKGWTASALQGEKVDLSGYCWYKDTNGVKGFQESDTRVFGSTDMGSGDLASLFNFYNNFGTDPAAFMLNSCTQL